MSTQEQCGYRSMHFCQEGQVSFISRYHDTNDYCVSGRRTSLTDAGELRQGGRVVSPADVEALRLFLLAEYAEYLQWHCENKNWLTVPVVPFDHHIREVRV